MTYALLEIISGVTTSKSEIRDLYPFKDGWLIQFESGWRNLNMKKSGE